MPNEENASSKPEHLRQTEQPKPYVLLALIEHGSRPVGFLIVGLFALFVLFQFKEPLVGLIKTTEELKVGSFEMRVRVSADAADVSQEYKDLKALNDQQIQLFLIVADKTRPHITYYGKEVTEENLQKLREAGLLLEVKQQENGDLFWTVSDKGHTLHELILKQVAKAIRGQPAT